MTKYEKHLSDKWKLPVEAAIKVEALSHNTALFELKKDLINQLRSCVIGYVPEDCVDINMDRLLGMFPFSYFEDKRYQIYIHYLIKAERRTINNEMTGDLSYDEERITSTVQGYYKYYPNEKQALKKFQEKSTCLEANPECYNPHLGCSIAYAVKIQLVDVVRNMVIRKDDIVINNPFK